MSDAEGFAELCRRVCESQNWELLPTGILVRWEDGRHQLIEMEFFESGLEKLVRLSSTIGEVARLEREQLIVALESNANLTHGAFSIHSGQLCMMATLMTEACDPAELEAAIDYLARQSDEFERIIFGTDLY
jgi:hypothetical protein